MDTITPGSGKRFIKSFSEYLEGTRSMRGSGGIENLLPNLENYLTLRRHWQAGVILALSFSFELGMNTLDELYDHPIMEELRDIALNIIVRLSAFIFS